jgi:hypothetical protein
MAKWNELGEVNILIKEEFSNFHKGWKVFFKIGLIELTHPTIFYDRKSLDQFLENNLTL